MKQSFLADKTALLGKTFDVAQLGRLYEEKRSDTILSITKSLPDLLANFPEEEKLIILIDIVGFSQSTTREQVAKIYLFQKYLTAQLLNARLSIHQNIRVSQSVPTGDGCYLIADTCAPKVAVDFLVTLISGFSDIQDEENQPMSLRAAALLGSCVPFLDMAHHRNYIGDGMNEAARILSGGQKSLESQFLAAHTDKTETDAKHYSQNALFVGTSLASGVGAHKDRCTAVFTYPAVPDKHGKTRDIVAMQGIGGSRGVT